MPSQERKDNFTATLVATFIFWGMMTLIFGLMLIPAAMDINIKYTRVIDINDDLKDRITLTEEDIEEIKAAPKWYGDQ